MIDYKKRMDKLVADMLEFQRKQVFEFCICDYCKWWELDNGLTCNNPNIKVIKPYASFGCNRWEVDDE